MARATKLTKLPADVEAALPAIRDEWLAIALSTEPADRAAAEAGVAAAYRAAGKEPPKLTIWLRSPLEGAIGSAMLKALPNRDQVWDQVWAQVRNWSSALISDFYGIWWSSWIETMRALGVTGLDPWEGQERVAANAYWWWCFKGFVVLSERPNRISRAGGRVQTPLRCRGRMGGVSTPGMALAFPSG